MVFYEQEIKNNSLQGKHMDLTIGSVVRLKVPCLENDPGALGICYEKYTIGNRNGWSFIFENGKYDGFSLEDVDMFLQYEGFNEELSSYKFENVGKLRNDFLSGKFNFHAKKQKRNFWGLVV